MRAAVVFLMLLGMMLAGAGQLIRLEQNDGARLRAKARAQEIRSFPLAAVRGSILDARGRPLVTTIRRPAVFVDATMIRNYVVECSDVGEILGIDPSWLAAELETRRARNNRYWKFARQVTREQADAIRELRRSNRTRAFGVEMENWREYPYDRLAAPILGFVGAEGSGMAGIELQFDDVLRGRPGRRYSMVDAAMHRIRALPDRTEAADDGGSIVLTIDTTIQQIAEKHVRACVEEKDAEWGVAIMMDPTSGEILACAVIPDYDPTDPFPDGMNKEEAERRLINHAIASGIEPGSIFKPFIAAAAVDDDLFGLDQELEIDGPVKAWGGRRIHDFKRHETLPLWEVLTHSSNIGMGMLGDIIGNPRLFEIVRRFGFGEKTGIRLPGEALGTVHPLRKWTSFSTQSIPIGQEILVTPMQTIAAFSALCNDGVLLRPRIVRGILSADGKTLEDASRPIAIRRVLSQHNTRAVREKGLRSVVTDGTGHRADLGEQWPVFGKTGTGQIAIPGGYSDDEHCASFVCGVPVDKPRIALLVSIYRAQTVDDSGGKLAAPVAKQIVADTLEYLYGARLETAPSP